MKVEDLRKGDILGLSEAHSETHVALILSVEQGGVRRKMSSNVYTDTVRIEYLFEGAVGEQWHDVGSSCSEVCTSVYRDGTCIWATDVV